MKMLLPLSTYLLASTVNAMTFHEKVVSKKIRQEAKNPLLTPRNLFVGKSETSMLCKDRPLGNQCCAGEDWNCQPPNSVCSCDQGCVRQNDCCSDYEDTCSHMLGTPKKTCKGTGTARANGDPHYMTFDEKVIHFQGNCTYLLSKNCKEGLVDFKIFGRNENRYGNMDMSWTKDIILMYKNIKIELLKGGKVMLNNERAYTPTLLPDGTKIDKSGNYVSISTFFGIQIFYDGEGNSEIKASCDWFDKLCGLLGNYNGDFNDDFKGSDDVTYNEMSVEAFGKSWKRPGLDNRDGCGADLSELEPRTRPWMKWVEELEQRPNGTMPHCTEQQFNAAIDRCSILIDDMANFQQCFDNVSPQKFYENCIWDQCATKLADGAFCDSLAAYGRACADKKVPINWRNKYLCPAQCPVNSHYEHCGSQCVASCGDPKPKCNDMDAGCFEGCYCNKGYLWNGLKCVKNDQCGCVDGDNTYQIGESFLRRGCSEECKCSGVNDVKCKPNACDECDVEDGIEKCWPSVRKITIPTLTTAKPTTKKNRNKKKRTKPAKTTPTTTTTTTAAPTTTEAPTTTTAVFGYLRQGSFVQWPECQKKDYIHTNRIRPDWIQPNACCGQRPYNDVVTSCCLNRQLYDHDEAKCCEEVGVVVPINEDCRRENHIHEHHSQNSLSSSVL